MRSLCACMCDIQCKKILRPRNPSQGSDNVIESGPAGYRVHDVPHMLFYSYIVLRRTVFRDIRLQKCCDLENRDRGRYRSLEMLSFNRAHITSY